MPSKSSTNKAIIIDDKGSDEDTRHTLQIVYEIQPQKQMKRGSKRNKHTTVRYLMHMVVNIRYAKQLKSKAKIYTKC
jgi:hypothetical protein